MCVNCAIRDLNKVVSELVECGQSDLAVKFESFGQLVKDRIYSRDSEIDGILKQEMIELATSFAKGYLPTSKEDFIIKINSFRLPDDERRPVRIGMKNAMNELFDIYGNRLPWALYGGFMFMVSRPNLHVAERLPELQHLLPDDLPWECVDAVWHGFPPTTALYLHILSVINKHTGTVPLHGCGCNHYLPPIDDPDDDGSIIVVYPLAKDIIIETEVPLSHCLNSIEGLVLDTLKQIGETTKSLQHASIPKNESVLA